MTISIPITGLSSNDPIPGQFVEVLFAQGPASSGQTDYSILLLANKLTSGSADPTLYNLYGPDTPTPLASVADIIALAGQGSEAHRMYKKAVAVNKSSAIYVMFVPESAGAQATGTITISTNASANSTLRIFVQDESVDVSIVSGDTPTVQAAAAAAAINSMADWAVSATASVGNVTVTAKQKGLRGNFIRLSARYLQASGSTVTPATHTALTGGTTADSNTNALAAIAGRRFYNIVSAAEDATQFGALSTQVNSMAAPIVGLRQRCYAGSVDTLANATTIATGVNSARAEVVWMQDSDLTPAELAANNAAVYALFESGSIPRCNFSSFGTTSDTQPYWLVKPGQKGTTPTRAQIKSALNNGLTPIGISNSTATYLVKRVTSRSLSGSVADYRIRDAHKVTISDLFADDLQTKVSLQFTGKLIGNDPVEGQKPSSLITPRVLKSCIIGLIKEYADKDLLENADDIIANTIVVREASPTTRLSARVPLDIIDILDQTGLLITQNG